MKKIWEWVKQHYFAVGFVGLGAVLFGACFWSAFAWIAAVYFVVFALLLHDECKVVGLILFLQCFPKIFQDRIFGGKLVHFIYALLVVILCGLYLWRIIKKTQRLNLKLLIPMVVFLIYVGLPFHQCTLPDFMRVAEILALLYIVFENRRTLDFRMLTRIFVWGLIVSCVFALFRPVSSLLSDQINANVYAGKVRFQGLTLHANHLGALVMLAACAMLILKLKNRLGTIEFVGYFAPLFVFGYLTLSRSFIVAIAAGLVIFAVFDLWQRKTQALSFLGILLAVIVVVGAVLFRHTEILMNRIKDIPAEIPDFQPIDDDWDIFHEYTVASVNTADNAQFAEDRTREWVHAVYLGQVHYDPGRTGLRKLYLYDWSSSAKVICFGRGVSRASIGQMKAHNFFIQILWRHGIVGCLLLLAIMAGAIDWRKIKQYRCYLPTLILLVPYFLLALVESREYDYHALILTITMFGFLGQLASTKELPAVDAADNPTDAE